MAQGFQSWGGPFGIVRVLAMGGAITLAAGFANTFFENCALAQITPDATLGAERSVVTPNTNVRGLPAELIEGGALRGPNLFHSFQEFNIGNGQRVYFANPTGIENILGRVTGNNLSKIFGTLGVDGGANLFLLNPNGIIFGPNARLDIAGSFVGSTANSLVFENGSKFSATNPEAPPLLTIKLRPGLQYGTNQPGATIANVGTLAVGKDLTLAAGNLDLQGQLSAGENLTLQAQDTVRVRDSVTTPFIATAGGQLLVQGDRQIDIFALNHPASGFFSGRDMVLKSPNSVFGDAHYTTGGNFRIEQLDGSLGNLSSPGDPVIRATGNVSFDTYQGASLHIFAGGSVNLGSVTITGTDATNFINETVPLSQTLPDGTNTVTINGSTRPTLDIRAGTLAVGTPLGVTGNPTPTGLVVSDPPTSADIVIGTVTITQPNGLVFITNNYQPNPALAGNIQARTIRVDDGGGGFLGRFNGNGGDVVIDSRGNIIVPSGGLLNTSSSTGKAGNIAVIANGSLSMTGGAQLDASTSGRGDAGDINLNVGNDVTLTGGGTRIQSFVRSGGNANSGAININAKSLSLTDGGGILNTVIGSGNGKDITINVLDTVKIDGVGGGSNSAIITSGYTGSIGKSGNINIEAGDLILTNGGIIGTLIGEGGGFFSFPSGQETSGDININIRNAVTVDGIAQEPRFQNQNLDLSVNGSNSSISSLGSSGGNTGGNINLTAGTLSITNGAAIDAITYGQGKAGNITLNVRDTITVAGFDATFGSPSGVSVATFGGANAQAGQLLINTNKLTVADGALLNASTYSSANGGDVTVNANVVELTGGGQILALPYAQGNGGNVTLNVKDRLTISGYDPTFGNRFIEFGLDVVTNQGNLSGVFTGYELGILPTVLYNIPIESTGNAGNISIIGTREVNIDGGELFTGAFNAGNAGTLFITQTGSVRLTNKASISTSTFGTGNAGTLLIETGNLSVQNQSVIVSFTLGTGDAGDLTIRANDSVEVNSGSTITSQTSGSGNAADLTIETRRLSIRNGVISAGIGTSITGDGTNLIVSPSTGRSGDLTVKASESVDISGEPGTVTGGLFTSTFGYRQGGELNVETARLTIQDGGRIEAATVGAGVGGKVTVNASESIELSGTSADGTFASGLSAYSRPPLDSDLDANLWQGNANSGSVNVTTNQLIIRDGAQITTAVEGRSQTGSAGSVNVQANSLSLSNRGRIVSRNQGGGFAGDINLSIKDTLQTNGGEISASSDQSGGGDINISANDIRLRNGSLVSSSVFDSTGGGGNITIESEVFLALEDTDILANAQAGPGGDITINSSAFLADLFSSRKATPVGRNPGSFAQFRGNGRVDISADSQSGTSGTVTLPTIDPTRGLTQLPSDLVDAEGLIDRRCTPSGAAQQSSFTVTGRGGLPPSPNEPLRGEAVTADWISLNSEQEKRDRPNPTDNPTSSTPEQLVEAQGWVIAPNGQVILTAQAPTVTPQNSGLTFPPCQGSQTTIK